MASLAAWNARCAPPWSEASCATSCDGRGATDGSQSAACWQRVFEWPIPVLYHVVSHKSIRMLTAVQKDVYTRESRQYACALRAMRSPCSPASFGLVRTQPPPSTSGPRWVWRLHVQEQGRSGVREDHSQRVGTPPGKLADAEVVFDSEAGPLSGLKLIGFAVWERRDGGRNVTFPARRYSVNGERRSFALFRPANGDAPRRTRSGSASSTRIRAPSRPPDRPQSPPSGRRAPPTA